MTVDSREITFCRIVAEGRSVIPEAEVTFLAPVTRMDKLACIGLNYSGHCEEQGVSPPESPVVFSKFPSNIIGPRDNIMLPSISDVSSRTIAKRVPVDDTRPLQAQSRNRDRLFSVTRIT